jgi:glucan phosphorylase
MINHDWQLAQLMTAGVDVWLNTPQPPLEASGTSGMKAALIGVPSLSILDEWWIEGSATSDAKTLTRTVTIAAPGLRQADFRWDVSR